MKNSLSFMLFAFLGCSTQDKPAPLILNAEEIALIRLKPIKYSSKPALGNLTAEVFDENGQMTRSDSAPWGDCRSCVRGFNVNGKIGIRVEGKSIKLVSIARKAEAGLKILDCDQSEFVTTEYTCAFALKNYYLLKLRLQN